MIPFIGRSETTVSVWLVVSQDRDHPGPGAVMGKKPEHTGLGAIYRVG